METAQSSKSTRSARTLRKVLGYAVSALFLVLIASAIDVDETLTYMTRVPMWVIVVTAGIGYLSIPLRVFQWRCLLGWRPEVSPGQTFRALCIGYLGNAVLPMRGGEFVKSYLLSRSTGIRFSRVLASVVVERAQDVLPILAVAALAAFTIPVSGDLEIGGAYLDGSFVLAEADLHRFLTLLGVASLSGCSVIIGAFVWSRAFSLSIHRALGSIPIAASLAPLWAKIELSIRSVASRRALLVSQGIAFFCWGLFVIAPIPLLMTFSLTFPQACLTAIAVTGLATFAHLLPSAPGAVGTFDALSLFAVLVCNPGMELDKAAAFTFVAHATGTLAPALPGLVLLPSCWAQLQEARENKELVPDGNETA